MCLDSTELRDLCDLDVRNWNRVMLLDLTRKIPSKQTIGLKSKGPKA